MKLKLAVLIVLLGWRPLAFCQKYGLANYLPGDNVVTVVKIEPLRLLGKVPVETFLQNRLFRELMKDPGNPFRKIMANPLESGVDFTQGIMVAVGVKKNGGPPVRIFGKLQDAGRFKNTIQTLLKDSEDSIETFGTDKILFTGQMTLGWNNDIFVISSGYESEIRDVFTSTYSEPDTIAIVFDSTYDNTKREPVDMGKIMEEIKKSQRDLCFRLLTPKTQNSFTGNPRFTELMDSPGDIKIWSMGEGDPLSNKFLPMQNMFSELQQFLAGTKTAIINFEAGKIVVQSHNYLQGKMLELYQKNPAAPVSMEFVQRLPAGKLLGIMNMSYNPALAKELLQHKIFAALMDTINAKTNLDRGVLQGAFKNHMTLAVIQTDENNSKEGIQLIAALPIADKAKFGALRDRVKQLTDSIKTKKTDDSSTEDKPQDFLKGFKPVIQSNDEIVVLSLTPGSAAAFLNDPGTKPVPDWMEPYRKYPVFIQVDLRSIISMFMSKSGSKRLGMNERILFDFFDKMIVYGGEFEKERISSVLEFRMGNPSENALKQIFNLLMSGPEKKSAGSDPKTDQSGHVDSAEVKLVDITVERKEVPPPPPPPSRLPKSKDEVKEKSPVKKKD